MIDDRVLYTLDVQTEDGILHFLALGVSIEQHPQGGLAVHWFDTNRGHATRGRVLQETEDGFVWRREEGKGELGDGHVLTFRVVTLERFEKDVRHRLLDVPSSVPTFDTDWELWEWYRRQFFGTEIVYKGRQRMDGTPVDEG